MSDHDAAFAGRCKDCGKLHAAIVVSPRTAPVISKETRQWERDGMTVESLTVGAVREELAMDCKRETKENGDG